MAESPKNTVTVEIAGEDYTIRTEADPEYALECAELVDRTIADILRHGALVEAHKAVILAALSLADQLLQTRQDVDAERARLSRQVVKLAADLETALPSSDLASPR